MSNVKEIELNNVAKPTTIKYDLADRTARFGETVITFARGIPKNEVTKPLVSQIVRSATSVGANYMEADSAASKRDFQHKISLCRKEAQETKYWLQMIAHADAAAGANSRQLWQEAQELTLIFSAILRTARSGLR